MKSTIKAKIKQAAEQLRPLVKARYPDNTHWVQAGNKYLTVHRRLPPNQQGDYILETVSIYTVDQLDQAIQEWL